MATRKRNVDLQKLREDLKLLIDDGEALLKSEGDDLKHKGEDVCRRLAEGIEAAKRAGRRLEDRALDEVDEIDELIHRKPYHTMGIACAAGLLLGLCLKGR